MGRVIREAAGWGREVKPRRACETMVKTGLTLMVSGMYRSGRVLRSDKIRLLFSLDHSSCGVEARRPVKCVSLRSLSFFPKRGLYIPTLLPLDMQCREEYSPRPPHHFPLLPTHPMVSLGPCTWLWFNGMCADSTYHNS